ncbi:MAG: hypothetical protein IH595_01725 [Bacteroidales bacterium]|nr:hypothetical protein [Bacteroidales bacterium]
MKTIIIHSAPRSGSTIFCKLLEEKKGYVVMPETYLPGALLSENFVLSEGSIESCMPDGFPISSQEIFNYINHRNNKLAALIELMELKYKPEVLVLKSTRIVSPWLSYKKGNIDIEFFWINRNPINIFESMSRVSFGEKNHNPLRFSVWISSYKAINKIGKYLTIDYSKSKDFIEKLEEGSQIKKSYSSDYHSKKLWHKNLRNVFTNNDFEKIKKVSRGNKIIIHTSLILLNPFSKMMVRLRKYYDKKLIEKINTGEI